jgi:hypothetical protein
VAALLAGQADLQLVAEAPNRRDAADQLRLTYAVVPARRGDASLIV